MLRPQQVTPTTVALSHQETRHARCPPPKTAGRAPGAAKAPRNGHRLSRFSFKPGAPVTSGLGRVTCRLRRCPDRNSLPVLPSSPEWPSARVRGRLQNHRRTQRIIHTVSSTFGKWDLSCCNKTSSIKTNKQPLYPQGDDACAYLWARYRARKCIFPF